MKLTQEEELYLHWKRNYYDGTTLVPDSEFDELETKLKSQGSNVINMVGSKVAGETVAHPSPMKSLQKINVEADSENYEIELVRKWINKILKYTNDTVAKLQCTLKYDGNAFNLIHKNGVFTKALTRGDGEKGQDVTHKLGILVDKFPHPAPHKTDCEIRGEVLIKKDLYETKYMDPQNPKNARNFVGGILNPRNSVDESVIHDLVLMTYDLKINKTHYSPAHSVNFLNWMANEHECITLDLNIDLSNYDIVYRQLLELRDTSEFLIDGFVIKFPEEERVNIPEKDHHPEWAMAIKFPPTAKSTYIRDIEWQLGKTGELTPVAILEPVDIDGSTVSKASMYNAGFVLNTGCTPGAKVTVVKAGEIIPKITEVILHSAVSYELPTTYDKYELELIDNIHLMIKADEVVDEIEIKKLTNGIGILGFKGIGPAACKDLYHAGITDISKFWTGDFTKTNLISSGYFKEGRSLDIIFEVINSKQKFKIKDVIHALQYEDAGKSVSRELGKKMSGVDYSFKSLTKKPIDEFLNLNSEFAEMYHNFLEILMGHGSVQVIYDEYEESGALIYELTGSPKPHFETKKDVMKYLANKGFKHGSLNADTRFLLTDDLESTTSKMKKAKKLGIEIKTYDEI